jgi:predicted RNA-binding protein with PIN domain
MPYLIDGSNLIGHSPHLDLSDPRSKKKLVAQLAIFQAIKKTKIILVFDGPPDPDLVGEKFRRKEFSVFWPDMEESADTVIERWIEKQTDLRHLTVVSSDREIKTFAKMNGAKVLDCEKFHQLLKSALKEHKESKSMNKEDVTLSPLEVDHWLEIFGASDE